MTARDIADIFERIQMRLIASLKRNLKRHKAEESEYGFAWPAWQAEKLQNLESFRRENRAIMEEYRPRIDEETAKLIAEEYEAGAGEPPGEAAFFGVNRGRIDSLIEDVNNNLHEAESSSLRMMDDVYRQTIYRAEMAAASGSMTMEQAVDMATKDFLSAGINCIRYRNGRLVNIDTYAEMAIRTASLRSYLRGEADKRSALGIDTVLVSQYGACSDTCLPWQGRVYIDDVWGAFEGERTRNRGKSRNGNWYPLLSVAVGAGLFHPNCRHTLTTWQEGISTRPEPMDAEKVRETAKIEKQQRRMECHIRRLKRLAEGSLDAATAKEYRRKARTAQAELRTFIAGHGEQLRRDYWRERTSGMPAEARAVAKDGESGILKAVNLEPIPVTNRSIQSVRLVKARALDDAGNRKLRKAHRELLRSIQDDPPGTEAIACYGIDMKPLAARKGGLWSVKGITVNQPHIAIHNHPSGETFSMQDIERFLETPDQIVLTVVGNGGQVHLMERMGEYDTAGFMGFWKKLQEDSPDHCTTPEKHILFMERLLKGAAAYGFRYAKNG